MDTDEEVKENNNSEQVFKALLANVASTYGVFCSKVLSHKHVNYYNGIRFTDSLSRVLCVYQPCAATGLENSPYDSPLKIYLAFNISLKSIKQQEYEQALKHAEETKSFFNSFGLPVLTYRHFQIYLTKLTKLDIYGYKTSLKFLKKFIEKDIEANYPGLDTGFNKDVLHIKNFNLSLYHEIFQLARFIENIEKEFRQKIICEIIILLRPISDIAIIASALKVFGISDIEIELLNNVNKLHAEMAIVEHFKQNDVELRDLGVAKLCCELCDFVLKEEGITQYLGTSHVIFDKWAPPEFLINNSNSFNNICQYLLDLIRAYQIPNNFSELKSAYKRIDSAAEKFKIAESQCDYSLNDRISQIVLKRLGSKKAAEHEQKENEDSGKNTGLSDPKNKEAKLLDGKEQSLTSEESAFQTLMGMFLDAARYELNRLEPVDDYNDTFLNYYVLLGAARSDIFDCYHAE